MEVQTVAGKISPSALGVTLSHEHIFCDLRWKAPAQPRVELVNSPVALENLGFLNYDNAACKDNLVLDDEEIAARELNMFKEFGGKTVVEATPQGLSPNPSALCDLSKRVGLNIIAGCGYYVARSHPPDMPKLSIDKLAGQLIREIQVGFEGIDVKAGIIGEIGTSYPLAENETKVLRAAARAQTSTGVAIYVHMPYRGKLALKVIDLLESEGVDAARIIIGHVDDIEDMTFEYHKAVAERGVYLGFDCFGHEEYVEADNLVRPRDTERIAALKKLIDVGFVDNLLLSQDVYLKADLRTFGGYGYDHIQRTIIPMLNRISVSDAEINRMMVDNPARILAY